MLSKTELPKGNALVLSDLNRSPDFQYSMTIDQQWMDTMGHVNHAHYLSFCEQARWAWAASRQVGREYIERTQMGWVILEAQVRYLKELRVGDELTVTCYLTHFKNKIGHISHQILRQTASATPVICAEVKVTFGFFDLRSRKLVMPSVELAAAWGIVLISSETPS